MWMFFVSFSCLVTLSGACNTMLKQHDESGRPVLGREAFSLTVTVGLESGAP